MGLGLENIKIYEATLNMPMLTHRDQQTNKLNRKVSNKSSIIRDLVLLHVDSISSQWWKQIFD